MSTDATPGGEPFISTSGVDPSYLREFIVSANEILENCEEAAVQYSAERDSAKLETLFRGMHTLKGDSGYLGFTRLGTFCHTMETLLQKMRVTGIHDTRRAAEAVLTGVDFLKAVIAGLENDSPEFPDPAPVLSAITELTQETETTERRKAESGGAAVETFHDQAESFLFTFRSFTDGPEAGRSSIHPVRRALKGCINAARTAGFSTIAETAEKALAALTSGEAEQAVSLIRNLESMVKSPAGRGGQTVKTDVQRPFREPGIYRSIRVDEQKIDGLFSLVNEFDLAWSRNEAAISGLLETFSQNSDQVLNLREQTEALSGLIRELRERVAGLRTIQARSILRKFERLVRDLAESRGKKIRLRISGESIEIDKTVADILSEPLTHAIRNACDHGIEPPEERTAQGKAPEGVISIAVSQENRELQVTVSDDGRGIDVNRLIEKARDLGLPLENTQEGSGLELVFIPGFSTSTDVSEVSGRGIGMDIIRTSVRSIGGNVDVTSTPGTGTAVILTVPVTAGLRKALIVEACDGWYAFPLESIREVLSSADVNIHEAEGQKGFMYNDAFTAVRSLDEILVQNPPREKHQETLPESGRVLVLSSGNRSCAVIVRNVLRTMELMIRPAPGSLVDVPVIHGVSVLGDGRIILLLNTHEIMRELSASDSGVPLQENS